MNVVLVTYADNKFRESQQLLVEELTHTGLFNKYLNYNENNLPDLVKLSPAMAYRKGGGYWIWKPYVIKDALENVSLGDIVLYMDSGMKLNSVEGLKKLIELASVHETILFKYSSHVNYDWLNAVNSTKITHWFKDEKKKEMSEIVGNDAWLLFDKICGGFMIVRKRHSANKLINAWYNLSVFRPELFFDELLIIQDNQPSTHRHDQSILTALAWRFQDEDLLILDEDFEKETVHEESALFAARRVILRQGEKKPELKFVFIWLKKLFVKIKIKLRYFFLKI